MFDVSSINKRYFKVIINGKEIEVEPPKIKALRRISELAKKQSEDPVNDLYVAVSMILSKNRTGYKVPEEVIDELDTDQLNGILEAYFNWIEGITKDPN